MITKRKIAVRIIRALQGGKISDWEKIDPREVYEAIELARNAAMEAFIQKNGFLDGEFITNYPNLDVLCDDVTQQKYTVLPARLISFSTYDGIRLVAPVRNQRDAFVKIINGSQAVYHGLEAAGMAGKVSYYTERVATSSGADVRIYYDNIPHDYNKVLVKMISSTYNFAEDEQLPIPAEFEQTLVEQVFAIMARQYGAPADKLADLEPIN